MTTNNHTAIASGAAANASTFNAPLGQLDAAMGDADATGAASLAVAIGSVTAVGAASLAAAIGNLTALGTTTQTSLVAAIGSAALLTVQKAKIIPAINEVFTDVVAAQTDATNVAAEVTAARAGYADLDARIDAISLAGSGVFTLANGAANAAQKVIVVDSTTGILAGSLISYTLVGGVVETNTVDTVDSPTQITCITNIGTGGIADNAYISMIPIGILMSSGAIVGAQQQMQEFEDGVKIHSTSGTTAKWALKPTYATFSGVRDEIMMQGWNVNGISGVRMDTSEAAIYTALEADYYVVGSGIHYSEWYVEFVGEGTPVTIQVRPFSTSVDRATGDIINQYRGDHTFYKNDETLAWQIGGDNGNLVTQTGIIRNQTNDQTWITQLNSTGTIYVSLIKLDANDQVFVGDGNLSVNTAEGTGKFGVGTVNQDSKLHVSQYDAGTNGVVQMVTVSRNSTGTTAAGFGSSILFELSNDNFADVPAARIDASWHVATNSAQEGDLTLYAFGTGMCEGLRIRGNGSTPELGFFGETPVAKPTGVAVSAGGIHAALVSLGLIAA